MHEAARGGDDEVVGLLAPWSPKHHREILAEPEWADWEVVRNGQTKAGAPDAPPLSPPEPMSRST